MTAAAPQTAHLAGRARGGRPPVRLGFASTPRPWSAREVS